MNNCLNLGIQRLGRIIKITVSYPAVSLLFPLTSSKFGKGHFSTFGDMPHAVHLHHISHFGDNNYSLQGSTHHPSWLIVQHHCNAGGGAALCVYVCACVCLFSGNSSYSYYAILSFTLNSISKFDGLIASLFPRNGENKKCDFEVVSSREQAIETNCHKNIQFKKGNWTLWMFLFGTRNIC